MTFIQKKKYQNNYLLKLGLIIFILFNVISITAEQFFDFEESTRTTRFNNLNVYQLFLSGVIIAPILEELAFRGCFTDKKIFKWISYILAFGFIFLGKTYFAIPVFAVFVIFFELRHRKNFLEISFVSNALLFSIVHYQFSDLLHLSFYLDIIATSGIALVLIWLVINFGLWMSILSHFLINGSLIASLVISYETTEKKMQKIEDNDFIMHYQQVSLFENNLSIESDKKTYIEIKNGTINNLFVNQCSGREFKELYFGKFNIVIKRKTGSNKILNCNEIQKLVEASDIRKQ